MEVKPQLENIALGEVLGIGAALGAAKQIDVRALPYAVIPQNWKVEDLSKFLPSPKRARGNVQLGDVESFVRYINKHKDVPGQASEAGRAVFAETGGGERAQPDADDMQTVILVDLAASKLRAFFDHHASDAPGWLEHTATYNCPVSPEWTIWSGNSGRRMNQEDFALFVEQNILDVHTPTGAEMLQIVTTLKSVKNVKFDSGLRLQDGQVQIKYHEENDTKAGENGQLTIPEKIILGIPVYVGGLNYAVEALFRYRIDGSRLSMWYDLVRPHKILEDALKKVVAQVEEGTGIKPYGAIGV